MAQANEHNLLVVSDLHLGEDLRPGGTGVSYLRHLVKLERELERFLRHHIVTRLDDKPWRLVVNGDMVDFMSMKIVPDATEVADGDDALYGLGFGELAAQKKMERVLERHKGVFDALRDFVAAGNELVVVVGNHDVEFHYALVQETFVACLCAGETTLAARIQFCPWFYYQADRVYIEHGHQFDEYCSFDYQLEPAPAQPPPRRSKSRFALSMAHAGMRYFANQLPEYDPHTAESWGVLNYVRWASALGLRGLARISYLYGLLVWKVVEGWYAMRGADGDRRRSHLARLSALSRHWQITEDKLLALAALHRMPATRRFVGLLRGLFLDRVLLSGFAIGCALSLATLLRGPSRFWSPALVLTLALVANEVLGRDRLESPAEKLRAVPRLIQKLVNAPLIVFGHSHAPERIALPNGALYVNTGSWASDDAQLAFTHLVVFGQGSEQRAELRQWRDGTSAPFPRQS